MFLLGNFACSKYLKTLVESVEVSSNCCVNLSVAIAQREVERAVTVSYTHLDVYKRQLVVHSVDVLHPLLLCRRRRHFKV